MDSQHFLYSLLLLLVGQIPLVIKLLLDHRAKADPYKKHLYERQASTFLDLYSALSKAHASLHNLLLAFPEPADDDEHKELRSSLVESLSEKLASYAEALDRAELFLPADVALHCWQCKTKQSYLFGAAMGIRLLPQKELWELWQKLSHHHNMVINSMRLGMGVDKLSAELLELLSRGKTKVLVDTQSLRESYEKLSERAGKEAPK